MTQPTTDRELLEMAAKAADMVGEWSEGAFWISGEGNYHTPRNFDDARVWNPRANDGDLLRLLLFVTRYDNFNLFDNEVLEEALQDIRTALAMGSIDDLRDSTLRAAAEIGRQMP